MTPLQHPALPLFLAALVVPFARGRGRGVVALGGAFLSLLAVLALPASGELRLGLLGLDLDLVRLDALSRVFALVLGIVSVLGTLYAAHVTRAGEHASALVYAGSSLGVVLAGDWVSLFLFWELMAVSSAALVWYGGEPRSRAAGFRYLLVHVAGGSLLFGGIVVCLAAGGRVVGPVPPGWAFGLILAGICLNAAVPPLHAWLTDAYPEASVTGTVFLSAFTTKTAVYVLIRAFPGATVLAWAGVVMALYGVVFAVLENDIRRLLAYHIVSQVGYMVAGVGIGTALALNGAAAHAFCHILYKGLLFMGAGAVLHATGRRKLTELGGLGRSMPLVLTLYMIGAFSISGVPLFSGFVSKSMVISAAGLAGRPLFEALLTLASVGTFLHTGLKLPYFTFFGRDAALEPRRLPRNMTLAMGATAALCIWLGVRPSWLYSRLPYAASFIPYTVDHVVSTLQLLIGTGVAFWLLRELLGGEPTVSLDTDWIYRGPLRRATLALVRAARGAGDALAAAGRQEAARAARLGRNPYRLLGRWSEALLGPAGTPESDYDEDRLRLPIGVTLFWIALALGLTALLGG